MSLTADTFIEQLNTAVDSQLIAKQTSVKTYYDSFDWRLYLHGLVSDFAPNKPTSIFTLRQLNNDQFIASTPLNAAPCFSQQFHAGTVRDTLEPLLDMRALLAICTLTYNNYQLNIVNNNKKTVVRLTIEAYLLGINRVLVQPIKGYDKAAEHLLALLTDKLGLMPVTQPVLLTALTLQGKKPNSYSSKLAINLDPDMRADIACKYIYSHLLNTLKANEHGVLQDIDSEFLHDFRVAVRRTRAGLSQLKAVLPDEINARFSQFFSWLGQITSATRDLDVYLLNFPQYKASLPLAVREDLAPLHQFLMDKQQHAQRELAKKLRSAHYVDTLAEWETYLKADAPKHPNEAAAQLTIKQVAKRRIWKIYNRVLQEGDAINDQTAAEALHDLRKTCKKLRYLMEFFHSIYPEYQIKKLISALKALQDVLGDFQDYQVQENNLKIFSAEMQQQNTPVNTFLAIGMLIQDLDARKNSTRQHFNHQFLTFKQAENNDMFTALFAPLKHHAR